VGDGTGNFAAPVQAPTGISPAGLVAADINGDNLPDLITANATSPGSFTTALNTTPVSVASFTVIAPASAVAGDSFSLTVTARSAGGVTLIDYTGTVHFTSTDGQAVLPDDVMFLPGDNGVKTVTITLGTAGVQTVSAMDTSNNATGTSDAISVSAAAAT